MVPIIVRVDHAAARADWRERTHVHPRSRQMRGDHAAHFHSSSVALPHGWRPSFRLKIWKSASRRFGRSNFVGALKALRSLSLLHRALQPAKQALDGLTNMLTVLFCMFAHDEQHSEGLFAACARKVSIRLRVNR